MGPPDLRAHDPSFADELAAGSFGLAGKVAHLDGRSPFAIAPPSRAWQRELHGFGWLRHLDPGASEDRKLAHKHVGDWIRRRRSDTLAWEPEIVARRIVSWLAHADLALDEADPKHHAAFMRSLTRQVAFLSETWRDAPDGSPRVVALIGLVQADLCIAGRDEGLAQSQKLLAAELDRQIAPDGCPIDRNPWTLVELLLDLLPLRRCFAACGVPPDPAIPAAIRRMTAMLRHLCLGNGMPARFNGMGPGERGTLASVLAYDEARTPEPAVPARGGYVRLQHGATVVLVDAGSPPRGEHAQAACAGCLSLEVSSGGALMLVNGGMPGDLGPDKRAAARATSSHNTLCLAEQSSARLAREARAPDDSRPLRHLDHVTGSVRDTPDGSVLEAAHDGYLARWGLIHTRTLLLQASGTRIEGSDRLSPAKGHLRFSWDVPFAIHFHLHPDVEASVAAAQGAAELALANGEVWRLTAAGATLSIEDSAHFAGAAGARAAQQVVLRGSCPGESRVTWTIERVRGPDEAHARARRADAGLLDRLAETGVAFGDDGADIDEDEA